MNCVSTLIMNEQQKKIGNTRTQSNKYNLGDNDNAVTVYTLSLYLSYACNQTFRRSMKWLCPCSSERG